MFKYNNKNKHLITLYLLLIILFISIKGGAQNHRIDSLKTILKTNKVDTNKIIHLNELSKEYIAIGVYDTASYFSNTALKLAQQLNFEKGQGDSYNYLGEINKKQGNYPKALKNYFTSLKIKEKIGDKKSVALVYNNIGQVYFNQSNYSEALKNNSISLKIEKEIDDKKGMAVTYNIMGDIYCTQGNYSEALKNYHTSLNISKSINYKEEMAGSYIGLSNVYYNQENYDQATQNNLSALTIYEALGNKKRLGITYGNLAVIYYAQEKYPEAFEQMLSSIEVKKSIGNKEGVISDYLNLSVMKIKVKSYLEAKKYAHESLKLSMELAKKDDIMDSYSVLSEIDSAQGNFKEAYENYKLFTIYRDSLSNEETKKQTLQTAMTYEFEKKEAVLKANQDKKELQSKLIITQKNNWLYLLSGGLLIVLLVFSVVVFYFSKKKLQITNTALELEQKLLRTQMNPHFIFNSLGAINTFIEENKTDEASDYLIKFSRLTRLILNNSRKEYISLSEEISTLRYYMEIQNMLFDNSIYFELQVDEHLAIEKTKVPPMLAQPFIENALKHGFKNKEGLKKIEIKFTKSKDNNSLLFEVKDNGVGITKAKETANFTKDNHESFALKITEERLTNLNKNKNEKIKIQIEELKNSENESLGTLVNFTIPIFIEL